MPRIRTILHINSYSWVGAISINVSCYIRSDYPTYILTKFPDGEQSMNRFIPYNRISL